MNFFPTTTRSLLFAAILLSPVAAAAQSREEQRGACMNDAFRLCSSAIPDEAAIEACLERSLPDLSPPCRAQFDTPAPAPAPVAPARKSPPKR